MMSQMPPNVKAAFDTFPPQSRQGLNQLRTLIFARAADLPTIGRVVEDLRWGQPAYLTPDTGTACSLRIGMAPGGEFALFVHCKTNLIHSFAAGPGVGHRIIGTRAVAFRTAQDIIAPAISMLIGQALTYHLTKKTPDQTQPAA